MWKRCWVRWQRLGGMWEPEQGHDGAESQALARFDLHPAVFHQGTQYFALFGLELYAKDISGELYRWWGDARLSLHPA